MATNPKVNGHYKSFAGIKLYKEAEKYSAVTEANYKTSIERGEAWGTGRKILGYTAGNVKFEGNFKFHSNEWVRWRDSIAPDGGWLDVPHNVTIVHKSKGDPIVHKDELVRLWITEVDHPNAQGTVPTMVNVTFVLEDMLEDGKSAIAEEEEG